LPYALAPFAAPSCRVNVIAQHHGPAKAKPLTMHNKTAWLITPVEPFG
jgi:hypothetical protein